jgi:alpha-L-rhamnosidase
MKSLLLALLLSTCALAGSIVKPTGLRCEYRVNPEGIDETQPRLTWLLTAAPGARGVSQSAYRIVVASTPEKAAAAQGDLWDSGKTESPDSVLVPYRGTALTSGMRAYWRVQTWDQAGQPSAWSETARWSMGLLNASEWTGAWIGRDETSKYENPSSPFQALKKAQWIWFDEADPATKAPKGTRWFRTTLDVPAGRTIRRAVFVVGADDQFELAINGTRAGRGNQVRMPEVLDVSDVVKAGANSIVIPARNNREGTAGLIGALRIEFASGAPRELATGAKWQVAQEQSGPWAAVRVVGEYGMKPWGNVGLSEENALLARMLRKEFQVGPGLKRATAYYSGLGLSELYVNGTKAGDAVLSPGLTDYSKRVLYVTRDITAQLSPGRNALGVMLGNGRYHAPRGRIPIGTQGYGDPKLRLQLDLEYSDGRHEAVVSDDSWRLTTEGPVRANNEYDGEEYDARSEMPGWAKAGFNDKAWEPARLVQGPPGEQKSEMAEPLRVIETLTAKSVKEIRPGVFIFDMGQNLVGWERLRAAGPPGTAITMRFAETLKPDGNLYVDNLRSARATDVYTLKGGVPETWEPRFTYHGYRYVEVTGYPGKPPLTAIAGRVVHDSMTRAGDFESSDAMLNKIHHNIYWGIRGNYRSIPTDCPQRDERQGWLGDRSVVSRSESYMFDVAAFYTKWETDLRDAQRPSGSIPDVVPNYWVLYNDGIVWPSTFVLVPTMVYEQYGDLRVIERNYPGMRLWIEYMRGFLKNGIMPKNTYGDWCVPPEKPELIHSQDPARVTQGALLSTAYYYKMLQLIAKYARLVDKPGDAEEYEKLAATVAEAFVTTYYKQAAAQFDNGTQTSSILPLAFNLAPAPDRPRIFEQLVRKIEVESNNHVGVGLVGAQWLMRTLSDNGRPDLALTIATQKTYPGWGYMVEKGATTVWELWNGDTADPAMNSGNHVMQIGDLGVWMYEYLAGIRSDPDRPGFKHTIIKPYPAEQLSHVRATHRSPYGDIASAWKREGGKLTLTVTVPPNVSATVYVPGKNVSETKGAHAARTEEGRAVYEVGSGSYTFIAE